MALCGGSVRRWGAHWRRALPVAAACGVLAMALLPSAAGAQAPTRYSEAGGCFDLVPTSSGQPAPGGTSVRFQATDLGS
jgi:hypothetical protein